MWGMAPSFLHSFICLFPLLVPHYPHFVPRVNLTPLFVIQNEAPQFIPFYSFLCSLCWLVSFRFRCRSFYPLFLGAIPHMDTSGIPKWIFKNRVWRGLSELSVSGVQNEHGVLTKVEYTTSHLAMIHLSTVQRRGGDNARFVCATYTRTKKNPLVGVSLCLN